MANNPFGAKPLPAALKAELDARRDVTANQKWFASRSNWVSLKSMCGGAGCDKVYATLQNTYSYIDEQTFGGKRPNPVITNVKVKAMGTIGSTRVATITILAFNEEQLDQISNCFLRSDMSIRVEFGWTVAASTTIAPGPVGSGRSDPDSRVLCAIQKQRESNPCYDGLQGRVGKWRINFNKDGRYWEIAIDIAAPSVPVLSLPVENFKDSCKCETKQEQPDGSSETVEVDTSSFRTTFQTLARKASEGEDVMTYIQRVGPSAKAYSIHLNGAMRDENGNSPGWFDSTTSFVSKLGSLVPFNTEESDEAYITLETFFKCIQKLSLTQEVDSDGSIYCTFDLSRVSQGVSKGKVHSSDPHICLIPGSDAVGGNEASDAIGGAIAGFFFGGVVGAVAGAATAGEGYRGIDKAETCIGPSGVDLGKILVNAIFINKCLVELGKNIKIQDLVDRVLNGINEAVGNLWELAVVDDTDCTSSPSVPGLVVIDLNNTKKEAPYEIKVSSYENGTRLPALVRDISMELQLSSAMQAQALYADVRTEATEDKCDQVRMKDEQKGLVNLAAPKVKTTTTADMCDDKCEKSTASGTKEAQVQEAFQQLRDEITASHKSNLYTKLVQYYEEGAETGQCRSVLLPFEVSLTFDGIGGFSYAQLISVDALPSRYKERYMYQIVAVDHDISYGDWTTTIKAKPRYRS